jgi:DNA repair protein SbcD/Mre11
MSIKILATADLHLGKTSADVLGDHASTKYTWYKIINWCIQNTVDVLVLCGDIVDWDNRFFEAFGPLKSGFDQLEQNGIQVYLVSGNHDFDVLSQLVPKDKFEHVHLLGRNGQWEVKPFNKDGQIIQFVGWSFPKGKVIETALLQWGQVAVDPNYPVIGLLHGDIDNMESQYGPIKLNDLLKSDAELWILGHIHKPQQFSALRPQVWYTGSPHALSAKESGRHGPLLITVETDRKILVEQIALSPVRYERLVVDVSEVVEISQFREKIIFSLFQDANSKLELLENVETLVYHVVLTGRHSHIKDMEQWAKQAIEFVDQLPNGTSLVIRKIDCQLKPAILNLENLARQPSPAGILAQTILAIEQEIGTPFLDGLIQEWKQKMRAVNEAGAYLPLYSRQRQEQLTDANARTYLLNECNRLLGELMDQVNETN